MSRFIESICLQNGVFRNLDYHQRRMNVTRYKKFGLEEEIDLLVILNQSNFPKDGKHKVRIVYDEQIQEVEFLTYRVRPIHSIRLVENNEIEYRFKSEDRHAFELMKDSIVEDEIIIVQNGQITDTSYSNLVFFDGEKWVTPATYLLNGTMRQALLDVGQIVEEEVNPKDLNRFLSLKLINAMMDLNESPELTISVIQNSGLTN